MIREVIGIVTVSDEDASVTVITHAFATCERIAPNTIELLCKMSDIVAAEMLSIGVPECLCRPDNSGRRRSCGSG